jgi:hypothetical protein
MHTPVSNLFCCKKCMAALEADMGMPHVLPQSRFCWNANSQDTGGLVEGDWQTLVLPKLAWWVA